MDSQRDQIEWRSVIGYEGLYEVSSNGQVRSLDRTSPTRWGSRRYSRLGRLLKQNISRNGYYSVELFREGKNKRLSVHRLVATAFLPIDMERPHVNHLDGVKSQNVVANLAWCTASENEKHSHATLGKLSSNPPRPVIASLGNWESRYESASEAGRQGFRQTGIHKCLTGVMKTHSLLTWRYA